MLLKSEIEKGVAEQQKLWEIKDAGTPRVLLEQLSPRKQHILIITGVRRCGKSTIMLQLSKKTGVPCAFFNFEDPRIFGFENS